MESSIIEHQPKYTVKTTDDGSTQWLSLCVQLPGVQDESDIGIAFTSTEFVCRVPGKYRLAVPLPASVEKQVSSRRLRNGELSVELPILSDFEGTSFPPPPKKTKLVPALDPSFAAEALKLMPSSKRPTAASKAKKKRAKPVKTRGPGQNLDDDEPDGDEVPQPTASTSTSDCQPPAPAAPAAPTHGSRGASGGDTAPAAAAFSDAAPRPSTATFTQNLRRGLAPKHAREFIETSKTFVRGYEQVMQKHTQAFADLDGELGDLLQSISSPPGQAAAERAPQQAQPQSTAESARSSGRSAHALAADAVSPLGRAAGAAVNGHAPQPVVSGDGQRPSDYEDQAAAPGAQGDEDLYAQSVRNANVQAAMEAYEIGARSLEQGDTIRGIRLLKKASHLDPGNAAIKTALEQAMARATATTSADKQQAPDTPLNGSARHNAAANGSAHDHGPAKGAAPRPAAPKPAASAHASGGGTPQPAQPAGAPPRTAAADAPAPSAKRGKSDAKPAPRNGAHGQQQPSASAPRPGPPRQPPPERRSERSPPPPPQPPTPPAAEADAFSSDYGRTVSWYGRWVVRAAIWLGNAADARCDPSGRATWLDRAVVICSVLLLLSRSYWDFGAESVLMLASLLRCKRRQMTWLEARLRRPCLFQLAVLSAAAAATTTMGVAAIYCAQWLLRRGLYQLAVAFWRGTFWFWAPLSAACFFQRRSFILSHFFSMFLFWALSRGWWNLGGTALAVGLTLLCFRPALAFTCVYIIRCACVWLPFYMSLPATAATLFCWLMLMGYLEVRNEEEAQGPKARQGARHAGGGARPLKNVVPPGCSGAVRDVLVAQNYYQVLGIAVDADEAAIKKAKRAMSLATHPDKTAIPGAKEAFQLVTDASDVLLDPGQRAQYDRELRPAPRPSDDVDDGEDFEVDVDGAYFWIPSHDGRRMKAWATRLPQQHWCSMCSTYHATNEGDMWAASKSVLFMTRTSYYVDIGGTVWDVTDWARATGFSSRLRPGDHTPFKSPKYRASPNGAAGKGRASAKAAKKGRKKR